MWFLPSHNKVGCLGKLPAAADFDLESRLGGAAEETLAQWLRGIPKSDPASGRPAPRNAGRGIAHGFLILDPSGRDAIAGCLWPSADAAGRSFPFALYTAIGRKHLRSDLAGLFPILQGIWKAVEDLSSPEGKPWTCSDGCAAPGAAAVRTAIQAARIGAVDGPPESGDLHRAARELDLQPFLQALFPNGGLREAEGLRRFVRFLGNFSGPERPAVALRAPWSTDLPAGIQAAFWSEWMVAALGTPPPLPTALFVPRAAAGHAGGEGIWLIWRSLLPQDGEVLFYGRPGHEFLHDLTPWEAAAATGGTEGSGPARDALAGRLPDLRTGEDLFRLGIQGILAPPSIA